MYQDIFNTSVSTSEEYIFMQFTRELDTGDTADDIPFGEVSYIISAWGGTFDAVSNIGYHGIQNRVVSGEVVIGDAGSCSPTTGCTDGNIRLRDETIMVTPEGVLRIGGNVEVCNLGIFYTVCDRGWDFNDARVACRRFQLLEPRWGELQSCTQIN